MRLSCDGWRLNWKNESPRSFLCTIRCGLFNRQNTPISGCILEFANTALLLLWSSVATGINGLTLPKPKAPRTISQSATPKTKQVKSYSTADGLSGPDLTGRCVCFPSRTGEMFLDIVAAPPHSSPKMYRTARSSLQIALTEF